MKEYFLTSQEEDNYCVCSVLQAVFRSHDIFLSQDEIASQLTPCEDDKGFYLNDETARKFMLENGFSYSHFQYNQTPFNEPDTLLKEMNFQEGIVGIGSHAFLLKDFTDPKVILIDPEDGKSVELTIHKMIEKMHETERGDFGLIQRIH